MFALTGFFDSTESKLPPISFIGGETSIKDDGIHGTGDLRIDGSVRVDIHQDGRVVISESAEVCATVRARSIRVCGTVEGDLYATESLVLTESSVVRATIHGPSISIEPGADLQGEVVNNADLQLFPSEESPSPSSDSSPRPFVEESAQSIFPLDSELDGVES